MPITDLPPLPSIGTGLPAPAWLDAGRGQYAHHYAAGQHTAACGRWRKAEAAWAGREALGILARAAAWVLSSSTKSSFN